ncbi:MAG: virulence factor [Alphaproteobacteria bacterium]
MAEQIILYWRDIPAEIIVREGRRQRVTRELDRRFMVAIDKAAMVSGADQEDAYLAGWRKSPGAPCGDDLAAVADQALAKIETLYPVERLAALAARGGVENEPV